MVPLHQLFGDFSQRGGLRRAYMVAQATKESMQNFYDLTLEVI